MICLIAKSWQYPERSKHLNSITTDCCQTGAIVYRVPLNKIIIDLTRLGSWSDQICQCGLATMRQVIQAWPRQTGPFVPRKTQRKRNYSCIATSTSFLAGWQRSNPAMIFNITYVRQYGPGLSTMVSRTLSTDMVTT